MYITIFKISLKIIQQNEYIISIQKLETSKVWVQK